MKKEPNIQKCIPILQEYASFCVEWSTDLHGTKFNRIETYLMSLLLRFGILSNSLLVLLPHYFNDSYFKLPVSLILRSINSDYLTIIYLLTFYSKTDRDQTSMLNELTMMDVDFLRSMERFSNEEVQFYSKIMELPPNSDDALKMLNELHHSEFPECYHVFEGKFKLKSIAEIRKSSNPKLFKNPQEKDKALTETNKFERIKALDQDEYGIHAFMAFKYYSQFQHPSSSTKGILDSESELLDKILFIHSIEHMILGTQGVMKMYFKEENKYSNKMSLLQKKLLEIIKE